MLCKDCAHFSPDKDSARGFGQCRRWHASYSVTEPDMAINEVNVEIDEGWGMIMGPEFGCVLFEAATTKASG